MSRLLSSSFIFLSGAPSAMRAVKWVKLSLKEGDHPSPSTRFSAAAAESNFSGQGLVHQMHFPFLFVCLFIYSGNFENCKLNSLHRIISRILCGTEQRVAFFMWVLIKTCFVVLLCGFFFSPPQKIGGTEPICSRGRKCQCHWIV